MNAESKLSNFSKMTKKEIIKALEVLSNRNQALLVSLEQTIKAVYSDNGLKSIQEQVKALHN